MKAIYTDGTYLRNNPTWHEEESAWKANLVAKMLNKNGVSPSAVCDVGCGAGGVIESLAAILSGETVFYGYEISPQAFEICRKKETERLHFFLGDVLEQPQQTFDVILALDVFEHVPDYLGFLSKLREKAALKVFHIPLDLSVQWVLLSRPLLHVRTSFGHLHYFSKETALATLNESGYQILDHVYTGITTELPTRDWKGAFMRVVRKASFSVHQDLTVRILGGYSLLVLAR